MSSLSQFLSLTSVVYSFAGGLLVGEDLFEVPGLGTRPAPCILHSGTQAEGAVALWGMTLSRGGSGEQNMGRSKEEEGKLFRLFTASVRKCHMLCLPPLQRNRSHILSEWDGEGCYTYWKPWQGPRENDSLTSLIPINAVKKLKIQ